jgi:acyl dehydratase
MEFYFEDFAVGQSFSSNSRVVSEDDIARFAELTGDFNKLHFDRGFATSAGFKGVVAHGLLTLSVALGLWHSLDLTNGTILAFAGLERVSFKAPVYPGDQIRIDCIVSEKRELKSNESAGLVRVELNAKNSGGIVLEADLILIIKKRTPGKRPEAPSETV